MYHLTLVKQSKEPVSQFPIINGSDIAPLLHLLAQILVYIHGDNVTMRLCLTNPVKISNQVSDIVYLVFPGSFALAGSINNLQVLSETFNIPGDRFAIVTGV